MNCIHIDLFSGIGGFSVALESAGFNAIKQFHSDIEKYPLSVFEKRFPKSIALGDVTKINWEDIKKEANKESAPVIMTGGFP